MERLVLLGFRQVLPVLGTCSAFAVMFTASVSCVQAAKQPPYNIILLTPDQLRADFLHTYGFRYPDSPNIDKFAAQGTTFLHAYSAGSWTTPSFGTILTGLFPTVHGMTLPPYQSCGPYITRPLTSGQLPRVPSDLALSPYKPILPELLKPTGMLTAADNANCWSIADIALRGWDALTFFPDHRLPLPGRAGESEFYLTAPKTTRWAQDWLKEHKDSRFFLWVHYMEPHTPYNAPPEYDRFKNPDDYPQVSASNSDQSAVLYRAATLGDTHAIHRLEQLYAAKISYMDHYVGQLLDTVRSLDLEHNTVVILMSDHGQLIFSHPQDFNIDDHRSLYDANQHVPLVFWGAGISPGRRVAALAAQYDILPTVLDLEGLPLTQSRDGNSLAPVLTRRATQVHHYVYGEETVQTPQYSVRDERYKLIETVRTGALQCFDLTSDRSEQNSVCHEIPEVSARLKAALDEHIVRIISEARSYPDWQQNQALAVLEQRDTPQLEELSPRFIIISCTGAGFQLTGRAHWRPAAAGYWAPPGDGSAWARWRFDTPLVGDYDVAVRWDSTGLPSQKPATHAEFIVLCKGATRSFSVDQSSAHKHWLVLGQFHDPISVTLTNRADGVVIAGEVRFRRRQHGPSDSQGW